jgi:3-deoxy-D-manno-octulosonic-acid transferase
MLLILATDSSAQALALNDRMTREGWIVGQRSRDEEPDPEVQLYIADAEGELGLWYRLAPVTYMGGTLFQDGAGRNPFEPAALGSAIIHGPHTSPYPDAYGRLHAADAARLVNTPAELSDAVSDLIAPDKAAVLAHNAWSVSSGGAEVAERVVRRISAALGIRPDRKEAI